MGTPAGLAALSAPRKLFPHSLSKSGCSEGHSPPNPLWTPLRHQAEGNSLTRKEPEPSQLPHLVSWNAPRPRVCLVPVIESSPAGGQQNFPEAGRVQVPPWGSVSRGVRESTPCCLEKHRAISNKGRSTSQHPVSPSPSRAPTSTTCRDHQLRGTGSYFQSPRRQKDSSLPSLTAQSNPTALRG